MADKCRSSKDVHVAPPKHRGGLKKLAVRCRGSGAAQQSGQGGSDSDFERRLSRLAAQRRQEEKAAEKVGPLDVLSLEPQFGRPEPPPEQRRAAQQEEEKTAGDGGFLSSGPAKARPSRTSLSVGCNRTGEKPVDF